MDRKFRALFANYLIATIIGLAFFFMVPKNWNKTQFPDRGPASGPSKSEFENQRAARFPHHLSPFAGGKVQIAAHELKHISEKLNGLTALSSQKLTAIPKGAKLSILTDRDCVAQNGDGNLSKIDHRLEHGMRLEAHTHPVEQDTEINDLTKEAESDPCIIGIAMDGTVQKNSFYGGPLVGNQLQLTAIQAPDTEPFFFHSSLTPATKVRIAIVDTGIDLNHPDLAPVLWHDSKGNSGYDFVNSDDDPMDDDGHGTHVAGIAAASGTNDQGGAGVMPANAELMAVKVLDDQGNGSYSNVANGIRWAVDHGAKIINLSLSGTGTSSVIEDALVYAINNGIVVVVAAGNEATQINDTNNFFTPASYAAKYSGVISVGAISATTHKHASFSNYGDFVEIAAPGANGIYSTLPNNSYDYLQGTSMASPVVVGAAGLAIAALTAMKVPYTAQDIENILLKSALQNPDLNGYVKHQAELNLPRLVETLKSDYLLTLEGGIRSNVE